MRIPSLLGIRSTRRIIMRFCLLLTIGGLFVGVPTHAQEKNAVDPKCASRSKS